MWSACECSWPMTITPCSMKLRALLEPEFDVVGEVGDGQALLEAAERLEPDVLVVDISMPVVSGIEAARRPGDGGCGPKIVFLAVHQDPALVEAALGTGAPPGIRPKNIGG